MLKDLLLKNRSYRRFRQEDRMSENELEELVGLTRLCASGRERREREQAVLRWGFWEPFCTFHGSLPW